MAGGISVGCRMGFMDYLMRSVSRVPIILFFRNGFEGGRTAVIAIDAVKVEVEVERGHRGSPTRPWQGFLCWLLFVFSP